jgi:hypothetical protein
MCAETATRSSVGLGEFHQRRPNELDALFPFAFVLQPSAFSLRPFPFTLPPFAFARSAFGSEFTKNDPDLLPCLLERPVGADHEVGAGDFVVDRPLRGEAGAGFGG